MVKRYRGNTLISASDPAIVFVAPEIEWDPDNPARMRFKSLGSVVTRNMDGRVLTPGYQVMRHPPTGADVVIATVTFDDADAYALTEDATHNGAEVFARIFAQTEFNGPLYRARDSNRLVVDIDVDLGALPSIQVRPGLTYTGSARVGTVYSRVAPTWDATEQLSFARGYAHAAMSQPAFSEISVYDLDATIAEILPAGWTLLPDTTENLTGPQALEGRKLIYLSLKRNAVGTTLAASPEVGPIEAAVANVALFTGVEGLSSPAVTGRTDPAVPFSPAVDSLPAFVTQAGRQLTIATAARELSGWNLNGYRVNWTGANGRMVSCLGGEAGTGGSQGLQNALNIGPAANGMIVEDCTFEGPGTYSTFECFINMEMANRLGRTASCAADVSIRDNRLLRATNDALKVGGNGTEVLRNYSNNPINVPPGTRVWGDSAAAYGLGTFTLRLIGRNYSLYESLVANNTSAPPLNANGNGPASNASWAWRDPHCDWITATMVMPGGLYISRNRIDWTYDALTMVGGTNIMRISRNNYTEPPMGPLMIEGNVWADNSPGFFPVEITLDASYTTGAHAVGDIVKFNTAAGATSHGAGRFFECIEAAASGQSPGTHPAKWRLTHEVNAPGPVELRHNAMGKGRDGDYMRLDLFPGAHVIFDDNVDSATRVAINPVNGVIAETTSRPLFSAQPTPVKLAPVAYGPAATFRIVPSAYGSIRYGNAYVSACVLKVDDQVVGHITSAGAVQVYANMDVTLVAVSGVAGAFDLSIRDRVGTGTMQGTLRVVAGVATVAGVVAAETYNFGFLGRSNIEYGMYTGKTNFYNHPAVVHAAPDDGTKFRYYGQNDAPTNPIIDVPINANTVSQASTNTFGMINACVAEMAAWFEAVDPNDKANFIDFSRQGRQVAGLVNTATLESSNQAFSMAKLKEIIAAVGDEPDLIVSFWDGFAKPAYLRLQASTAPAAALTLPNGGQDTSIWNLVAPAGQLGTPEALFTTNTKLARIPHMSAGGQLADITALGDADWQKILAPDYVGYYRSFAASGGHAYSNDPAGQALTAHTNFIPAIAAFLYRKGKLARNLFTPGKEVSYVMGPSNAYMDVRVRLMNDGVLQRTDLLWGVPLPATRQADDQDWNWFGTQRSGELASAMTPFFRPGLTTYRYLSTYGAAEETRTVAASHRGTVTLQNAGQTIASVVTSTGEEVLNGRWATLRITPEVAFASGDQIHAGIYWEAWLDAVGNTDASSLYQQTLRFPRESVPHIMDPTLLRPFAGLDLHPIQEAYLITTTGPRPASLFNFLSPNPSASGVGSVTAVTDGHRYTQNATTGSKAFAWNLSAAGLVPNTIYKIMFDIETSVLTPNIKARVASNLALSTIRGLDAAATPAAVNTKQSFEFTFTANPSGESDYIGFQYQAVDTVARTVTVTNMWIGLP